MKILITGAAGYIGSVLIDYLFSNHDEMFDKIIAVDSLMYNQTTLTQYCHRDEFEFHKLDVRDYDKMLPLVQEADVIIPLACIVGMPACKKYPELTVATNQEAVQWLTTVTRPDQKIIFPTTNSGYGIGQDGIHCTEETPLNPISLYGVTKTEAEKSLLENGNAVTLRLATVFIVLFESHFKRNFIHIRDIAYTFVFVMRNFDKMKGQTYNVGLSSANISKKELCEVIKTFIPDFYIAESEINEDPDKRNYIVSNDKLESLNWFPKVTLEAGIAELLKAYPIIENSNNNFTNL